MRVRQLLAFLRWVLVFPSDRRPRTLATPQGHPEKLVVLRSGHEVRRLVSDLRGLTNG